MQRFNIYVPSEKFRIGPQGIVLLTLIGLGFLLSVNANDHGSYHEIVQAILVWATMATALISAILSVVFLNRPVPLNGKLQGFLEFHKEQIIVDDLTLHLESVRNITIYNTDFYGRGGNRSISNGVDNRLVVSFKNGAQKTVQFEIYNEYDMGKIQDVLMYHHQKGKMSFDNLVDVLKFTEKTEIAQLKDYFEQPEKA